MRFQDADITGLSPDRINAAGIARTFQQVRLFPNLTVLENVLVGMHARTRAGMISALFQPPWVVREEAEARRRALEWPALFQSRLLPRLEQKASALSYANRRRLDIARALASAPRLLLLDEPTAGMNPNETRQAMELIDLSARPRPNGAAHRTRHERGDDHFRPGSGAGPRREDR